MHGNEKRQQVPALRQQALRVAQRAMPAHSALRHAMPHHGGTGMARLHVNYKAAK